MQQQVPITFYRGVDIVSQCQWCYTAGFLIVRRATSSIEAEEAVASSFFSALAIITAGCAESWACKHSRDKRSAWGHFPQRTSFKPGISPNTASLGLSGSQLRPALYAHVC